MRNKVFGIIVFILLCSDCYGQLSKFAMEGSKWFYENKGFDTSVKFIRISRSGSTSKIKTKYGTDSIVAFRMRRDYLYKDSSIAKTDFFILDTFLQTGVGIIDTTKKQSNGSYIEEAFFDFRLNSTFTTWISNTSDWINISRELGRYNTILINNKPIGVSYISSFFNDSCVKFCGPFLQRILTTSYFFAVDVCSNLPYYGGPLVWYEDPELGKWHVPDSLKTGCSYTFPPTVSIKNNRSLDNNIELYPNPAMSNLVIKAKEIRSISLFNLNSELLNPPFEKSFDEYRFDLNSIQPGIYLLKIQTDKQVLYKKIVKV